MTKTLKEHNNYGIDATIIADSLSPQGQRLTTFVLTMPRIVLAEFNTHRMLSRNSASSRAIPFKKMVKKVEEHPFIPIKWQKDHKGMQGDDYFTAKDKCVDYLDSTIFEMLNWNYRMPRYLRDRWLFARDLAVKEAKILSKAGLTKQLCNRLLEPFLWHTVIATASEWENFFALRAHSAAEIHIAALAGKMLEEYNEHSPTPIGVGEWHVPFGDNFDEGKVYAAFDWENGFDDDWTEEEVAEMLSMTKVKIATARCARVSYLNFEGKDDYTADIKLHDRLKDMGHWSPFEHSARVMTDDEYRLHLRGVGHEEIEDNGGKCTVYPEALCGWSGNFRGFIQYRKMFENENKKDERVKRVNI